MRTAVYALAGLAAASGVSAFMPQAHFAGRAPSLRTARAGRSTVAVGMPSRPAAPFRMSFGNATNANDTGSRVCGSVRGPRVDRQWLGVASGRMPQQSAFICSLNSILGLEMH